MGADQHPDLWTDFRFYALLPFQLQSGISKDFPGVNEKNLERYLKILTLFRNVCAHNERLILSDPD